MRRSLVLIVCLLVSLPALAVPKSWTGVVSGNWSDPLNWSPQSVPAGGESLLFPAGAGHPGMTNDLPVGTSFGPMTFNASYTISGNELTLMGDVTMTENRLFVCYAPLKLGASVHLGAAGSSDYNGAININGQTLTIDSETRLAGPISGNGTIAINYLELTIASSGTFSGTISGNVHIVGSYPSATVTSGHLSGAGTVGPVTITGLLSPGDSHVCCGETRTPATLQTGSLTIVGMSFREIENGYSVALASGGSSSQVRVQGTVSIGGTLNVTIASGSPSAGETFTIIDNDGTDPVIGTFDQADPIHPSGPWNPLSEGTTFMVGPYSMRISYRGGDGNDVVLTALAATSIVLTQNASSTKVGESWKVTATVVSAFGIPSGSVSFVADGVTLGSAPVVNGVASLTTSLANAGSPNIMATFLGTGAYADTVSGSLSHIVARGQTKTEIVSNHPDSVYGQTIRFNVTVGVLLPAAGQPAGSVTLLAGGAPLGTVPVVNGLASFETAALPAGANSITASYSGDTNFEASTGTALAQNVAKAKSEVDARLRAVSLIGEVSQITVFVTATPPSAAVPLGSVTVSEDGSLLGTQTLAGGAARFVFPSLAVGNHTLIVNYSGGPNFDASSETVIQSVTAPVLSIHGTRVLEGNAGVTSVSVTVTLSAPITQPVRVSFVTLAASATEGEDYEKSSGVIEFAAGDVTRSIELEIFGDTVPEPDETFSVLLSNPVNATIDTPSAVVVIVNDDQALPRRRAAHH
jgi:hypothetical protein